MIRNGHGWEAAYAATAQTNVKEHARTNVLCTPKFEEIIREMREMYFNVPPTNNVTAVNSNGLSLKFLMRQ